MDKVLGNQFWLVVNITVFLQPLGFGGKQNEEKPTGGFGSRRSFGNRGRFLDSLFCVTISLEGCFWPLIIQKIEEQVKSITRRYIIIVKEFCLNKYTR